MNILCVCSGNTCRSPMLQTLLQAAVRNAKHRAVTVSSAGTSATNGDPASAGAQRAMLRRGLTLGQHASRPIGSVGLSTIDAFFCMTTSHAAVVRSLGVAEKKITVVNAAGGGVPDPWGGDDDDYESTAQVLEMAAREIAQDLKHDV